MPATQKLVRSISYLNLALDDAPFKKLQFHFVLQAGQ